MSDKVRLFALGGLDEDGKNCIVVDINNDIFVIGCGIKFPDRTMPGVDYVIPNFDWIVERKDHVKAYLLLHGHDDEIAALVYLYKDVPAPIYCSSVTASELKGFAKHVGIDSKDFDFHIIPASCSFNVAGRKISFFQTSHNIGLSSGVAISTDKGNIVYTGDFVVENNADKNYLHDALAISSLGKENTLVLMSESVYASNQGYTAPNYKITKHIERTFKDATGRLFIALFSNNGFNIDEIIKLAVQNKKKIIPYDEESARVLEQMQSCGQLMIPRENFARSSEIIRIKSSEIVVLLLGYGAKLYNKIALFASGQAENKMIVLNENDTFILACPSNANTEIEATDAHDEVFKSGCHVLNLNKKQLLIMHASEEDLKMMISVLHPKYYIPMKGSFKDLLKNAQVALSMGINLSHQNVFLLENGLSCLIEGGEAHLFDEHIPHGDIFIDGIGVGDVQKEVIADRQALAEGVFIMSAAISIKNRRLLAGPDVQIRGLTAINDPDVMIKEVSKVFVAALSEALGDESSDIEAIRQFVYERTLRAIRRQTGKSPMVLPLIIPVD